MGHGTKPGATEEAKFVYNIIANNITIKGLG